MENQNKKNRLKNLIKYSAASAAFISVHEQAEANIVYRDINPDSTIVSADTLSLDIDLDGVNDIELWIESKTGTIVTASGASIQYTYRTAKAEALFSNVIMGKLATASGYQFNSAYRFESGEVINDSVPVFDGAAFLAGAIITSGVAAYSGGPWSGITDKIMGVRFKINGANHYAWIRLSVGAGGNSITVNELAYDNVADIPIAAGLTSPAQTIVINDPVIFSENGNIHVQIQSVLPVSIKIYSVAGQLVYSELSRNQTNNIRLNNVPGGNYFILVEYENKIFAKQIFYSAK